MRGVTILLSFNRLMKYISTHTPHARRDDLAKGQRFTVWEFQLTRLMRGVTPHSARKSYACGISTHTPHARRDA